MFDYIDHHPQTEFHIHSPTLSIKFISHPHPIKQLVYSYWSSSSYYPKY